MTPPRAEVSPDPCPATPVAPTGRNVEANPERRARRSPQRPLLAAGVALVCALSARRAHALRDPSSLEIGGSTGAQDAHIACGPDVRVRHASGGTHYEKLFQATGEKEGTGVVVDVRAGIGTSTITAVSVDTCPTQTLASSCDGPHAQLEANERGRAHFEASAQATVGYDWRTFELTGGLGVFGIGALTDDHTRYRQRYWPLPSLDLRVGQRVGMSGQFGVGAPPVAGLARWYGLYALVQYRFKEGGEVGLGSMAMFGELEARNGLFAKGGIPLMKSLALGAFGMVDATDKSQLTGFNWTVGGGLTFVLDDLD